MICGHLQARRDCAVSSDAADGCVFDLVRANVFAANRELWKGMARQICEGVAGIHDMGVAHNNIRPQCILYVTRGKRYNSTQRVLWLCCG